MVVKVRFLMMYKNHKIWEVETEVFNIVMYSDLKEIRIKIKDFDKK